MACCVASARPAATQIARSQRPSQRPFAAQQRAAAARRQPRRPVVAAAEADAGGKYPAWEYIQRDLVAAGVPSLSPEQAFDEVELGRAVLVDVRPRADHDKAHPRDAVSVPAFLVIDSPGSPGEFAKWLACKANGVTPTKPNPNLAAEIAAAADGKSVILACEAGGTLEPSVNFQTGKESRSLKAAWKVVGSKALPSGQVKHLQGGVYRWAAAGMPMIGEYDGSGAGRTPGAAETPTGAFIDRKK